MAANVANVSAELAARKAEMAAELQKICASVKGAEKVFVEDCEKGEALLTTHYCRELYCRIAELQDQDSLEAKLIQNEISGLVVITPEMLRGFEEQISTLMAQIQPIHGPEISPDGVLSTTWDFTRIASRCREELKRAKAAAAALQQSSVASSSELRNYTVPIHRAKKLLGEISKRRGKKITFSQSFKYGVGAVLNCIPLLPILLVLVLVLFLLHYYITMQGDV